MAGNYFHDPRPFYGLSNHHNLISMDELFYGRKDPWYMYQMPYGHFEDHQRSRSVDPRRPEQYIQSQDQYREYKRPDFRDDTYTNFQQEMQHAAKGSQKSGNHGNNPGGNNHGGNKHGGNNNGGNNHGGGNHGSNNHGGGNHGGNNHGGGNHGSNNHGGGNHGGNNHGGGNHGGNNHGGGNHGGNNHGGGNHGGNNHEGGNHGGNNHGGGNHGGNQKKQQKHDSDDEYDDFSSNHKSGNKNKGGHENNHNHGNKGNSGHGHSQTTKSWSDNRGFHGGHKHHHRRSLSLTQTVLKKLGLRDDSSSDSSDDERYGKKLNKGHGGGGHGKSDRKAYTVRFDDQSYGHGSKEKHRGVHGSGEDHDSHGSQNKKGGNHGGSNHGGQPQGILKKSKNNNDGYSSDEENRGLKNKGGNQHHGGSESGKKSGQSGGKQLGRSQSMDFRVNLCCENCERKVKKSLKYMDDVDQVLCDQWNNRVVVVGNAKPESVLKKLRKVKTDTHLWQHHK